MLKMKTWKGHWRVIHLYQNKENKITTNDKKYEEMHRDKNDRSRKRKIGLKTRWKYERILRELFDYTKVLLG